MNVIMLQAKCSMVLLKKKKKKPNYEIFSVF